MRGLPSKILVRAPNWVGDAIMSLPAVRAVRASYPGASLSILARQWVAGIYARESCVDEVIPYDAAPGWRDLGAKRRIAAMLRARRFDTAILLQNAFEAAALVRAAGISRRVGYERDGRGWLLTDRVPVPALGEIPAHERYYYLELLRRSGIIRCLPACDAIRLEGAAQARERGLAKFRQMGVTGPVVSVSPGAAFGTAKRWLPERFAETALRVARANAAVVAIFGSSSEAALCEAIADQIRAGGGTAIALAGKTTLPEFIDLAAASSLYLTNDSGAMHIASALEVPTVAIFGSTNHETTGPSGPHALVIRQPVECSPCLLRECPIDHRCMQRVTVDRVAGAAMNLMHQPIP
jgi:heptosyltransferase-2